MRLIALLRTHVYVFIQSFLLEYGYMILAYWSQKLKTMLFLRPILLSSREDSGSHVLNRVLSCEIPYMKDFKNFDTSLPEFLLRKAM